MKIRVFRMALALAMVFAMLAPGAQAVQYVTFEDIPGDWNNYEASIRWVNADYVPSYDYAWVDTELLEGGWVAPGVLEYIADPVYAYQNPNVFLGYLYIDTPGEILYISVFEGNWETKEYMLMSTAATDGMFVDMFFPSFDREGKLLNTDRVYLYEYEMDGQWYCECVTFYFRYDGEETRSFLPKVNKNISVKKPEATDEPEIISEETAEEIVEETAEENEIVTEEVILSEDIFASDDVIISDDEAASIGIIGGADGPTSVIVSGSDSAFLSFFENVLGGLLSGAEEVTSAPTTPAPGTDVEIIEEIADEAEATLVVVEEIEVVAEEIEEETVAGATAEPGSKFFEFFSGVFGN